MIWMGRQSEKGRPDWEAPSSSEGLTSRVNGDVKTLTVAQRVIGLPDSE